MTGHSAVPTNAVVSVPKPRGKATAPVSPEIAALQDIGAKLDRVIAVLAAQGKDKDKQIEILSAAGCDSKFIGIVVGMTAASVRKFQSRQRGKTAETVVEISDAS